MFGLILQTGKKKKKSPGCFKCRFFFNHFSLTASPVYFHAVNPSFLLPPSVSVSSFSFSCCQQIPFNSEEIRRALIAVHNFAVPQIKVLLSFFPFFIAHCLALWFFALRPDDFQISGPYFAPSSLRLWMDGGSVIKEI